MTTIKINLPLVDARSCNNCPYWDMDEHDAYPRCAVFRKFLPWPSHPGERLPECLAAEVEGVGR